MARVATNRRGPSIRRSSIARLSATSAYSAPSVPRSRRVVNPASSVARACTPGAQRAVGDRFLQHLFVPARLVVRVQEQVRMQVHEPGQQRGAGQLDHLGVRGRVHGARRTGGDDALALHQHDPAHVHRLAGRPHLRRPQQQRRVREGRRRYERREQRECQPSPRQKVTHCYGRPGCLGHPHVLLVVGHGRAAGRRIRNP